MSSVVRSKSRWTTVVLASLVVLGALLVLCALAIGLLDLVGAVSTHRQHGAIVIRPLPVPRAVLIGLVYGLIPVGSSLAILVGLLGRPHRWKAARGRLGRGSAN